MRAMKTQFDGKTIKVPKQLRNVRGRRGAYYRSGSPSRGPRFPGLVEARKKPPSPRSGTTMRIQSMTPYKPGEVVLVRFPFSDLSTARATARTGDQRALVNTPLRRCDRLGHDQPTTARSQVPDFAMALCRAAQADLVQAGDWHTCLHLDPTPYRSVARCRFSASPSRLAPDGSAGVFEIARR